ncbi:MAG TPA: asparagine synthase (glutamine-hydrolyzing) [Gemmatimonadales bacterium]|nr:asparagine synthase (glutamine-hydrolyzing) [Gemmatimonadales bacterium]
MCGIFGAVSLTGEPLRHPECVAAMARSLAHRGPDGEQIVGNERARIGARRLAIMDLTTGDQPFQSPDGCIWMVCNGEIYNAHELRAAARARGYPFRSTGDIETIVPLYQQLGADAVSRLEGMFALAVWDAGRDLLVLARDRAGEKPMFWTEIHGELRFASELQALLAFPDQPRRLDTDAADFYLALGYTPAPRTLFAGVHKLPPGYVLTAGRDGVVSRAYWDPAVAAAQGSRLHSAPQLCEVLLRAIERELMSDVPVGVFTSGGLDSSLLAAAASRVMAEEKIHTYAVKFPDPSYDESPSAAAVTKHIRTIHHVVTATDAELERALGVVSNTLAEPVGDPALLPTFLLAEAAREHVKVVLSGEGADELFGGYPTYLGHKAAGYYARLPAPVRHLMNRLVDAVPVSNEKVTFEFMLKQFVATAAAPPVQRHLRWFGALGPTERITHAIEQLLARFPAGDRLNQFLWLDFITYLPDNLLTKVDRGTMLASIEARAPYLDRELLELVLPAPSALKVRGTTGKAILREAARGLVPEYVIGRRKRGLSVPVARWLNTSLAPLVDRVLARPRIAPRDTTARLLQEHRTARANHARKLWPLVMVELWAERWNVDTERPIHDAR